MLRWVKEAGKSLPHPLLMRVYTQLHRWREQRRSEQARRRAGVPSLSELDLGTVKGSDTLFVLGSGPSINRIPAERWQAIARHDTVGFNLWLLHPLVPKMYFFESLERDNPAYQPLLDALAERAGDYAETVKVIMDMDPPRESLFELPTGVRHKLYGAKTISMLARDEREVAAGLRYLKRRGAFRPASRFDALMKYNGTLTTMITLGLKMSYRTIVLCGIDLKRQEYFFQDPVLYPRTRDMELRPREKTHFTNTANPWMVPMSTVVDQMQRSVLEPAGVELYVESRDSALWPRVAEAPETVYA